MRSAPSVNVPVGRSRFGACLALGLWGLGVADLLYWTLADSHPGLPQAVAALLLAAAGVLAWLGVRRQPEGELAWDGSAWSWRPQAAGPGRRVEVLVACDLQRWMLLQLTDQCRTGRGALWLWLEVGAARTDWLALRRAVYSRATPNAQPEGPAATP